MSNDPVGAGSAPLAPHPLDEPGALFWAGHPDGAAFTRMQEQRLERAARTLERLLAARGPRTLENTLGPYDEILRQLDAASSQAGLMEEVHPDAAVRAAAEQASQKAASFATALSLNHEVYEALAAIDASGADAATRHYLERELRDFRLAGVDRDEATRRRVKELREQVVSIGQEFSRNIRSDERTILAEDARELEGLPQDFLDRHTPGPDGKIVLSTDYTDSIPVLLYARSDALRARMYMEFNNRAYPANQEVLARLFACRHEIARVLGFQSWADYVTADKMVGSGRNASDFIDRVVAASGAKAQVEFQALLERKRREQPEAQGLTAWEVNYWSEQLRRSDYDFDSQSVRPYFPFARVQQGVLDATGRLFGVSYRRVADAPVWHPSVECWEMIDEGRLAGRFYLDLHPRPDKYKHAAQFDVRTGIRDRQIPEAVLVCNFPGGEPGDPGLMEFAEVRTFFHEFGHLLHSMFAGRQRWCGISGIRTEHDFVEAPSQMLEEWTRDPAVLASFARHHATGEPIPAALVRQMTRALEFGKGMLVRRQMVYARLSLSCYDRDPSQVDPDAILKRVVAEYQAFPFVEGTHMQCSFGHLDGYSAIYYTYMWSLVIAKDLFSQFDRADLLAPGVARRYRDTILAPGGSAPAARLVESFLGRPFDFGAWERWLNEAD